jgi:hypothetical protein
VFLEASIHDNRDERLSPGNFSFGVGVVETSPRCCSRCQGSETYEKRNQAREGVNGMDVQEQPVIIGGMMCEGFETFADHVRSRQLPKVQVLKRLKQRLVVYEQTYGMSSEAFYRRIAGTPAEDEPEYLLWKMDYEAYVRLMENTP